MNYIHQLQADNKDLKEQKEHDQAVIDNLVSYLNSDKFIEDTTVQTRDVLNRLER